METYIFVIGKKTLEIIAPSVDTAYRYAEAFATNVNWKGRVKYIGIK